MPIQFQNFTPMQQQHYTLAETQKEKDAENERKISQINAEGAIRAGIAAQNNNAAAAQQYNSLGLQREVNNANVAQQGEVNDQNQQKINADIYNNAESNKLTASKYAEDSANQKLVNDRQAKMDEANISNMGLRNQMEAKKEERFTKQDENAQAQLGLENKRKEAEDARTVTADKRKTFEQERADAEFNANKKFTDQAKSFASLGTTFQLSGEGTADLTKNASDISSMYGIQIPEGAKLSAVTNQQTGAKDVLITNKGTTSPLLSTENNPISFGIPAQKMFNQAYVSLGGGKTDKYMTVKDSEGNEVLVNSSNPNESYTGNELMANKKAKELRQAQAAYERVQSQASQQQAQPVGLGNPNTTQSQLDQAKLTLGLGDTVVKPQPVPEQAAPQPKPAEEDKPQLDRAGQPIKPKKKLTRAGLSK